MNIRVLGVYCGRRFIFRDGGNSEILGEVGDGDLGVVVLEEKGDRVEWFRELSVGA